jgi:hypothetical protein
LLICCDQPLVPGSTSTNTLSLTPPADANIHAEPSARAETRPFEDTENTELFVVLHAGFVVTTRLPVS